MMRMICLILSLFIVEVFASPGDNHYVYRSCLNHCKHINCSTPLGFSEQSIFQWSCPDECAYECMWQTVSHLQANNRSIVQFHGKWPFKRVFGIQEPASTLFSILNLLSNYFFGYRKLRQTLRRGVHPLYSMWMSFCLISINAWIWSTVFHARDKPLTEIFDYIGAISLIFAQFICCIIRIAFRTPFQQISYKISLFFFIFFLYHSYYLLFIKMDYGYNMTVNVLIGLLNVICWLLWSVWKFSQGKIYVWKCALSVILTMSFVGLELLDFSPIAWTIDAHALWHLATVILPFIWYKFVVDDSNYLLRYPN